MRVGRRADEEGESWRRACKQPGFSGYFLTDTGEAVMSSIGLFDTSTEANESARVASEWVRDETSRKSSRIRRSQCRGELGQARLQLSCLPGRVLGARTGGDD
jgi:hypothetical protein